MRNPKSTNFCRTTKFLKTSSDSREKSAFHRVQIFIVSLRQYVLAAAYVLLIHGDDVKLPRIKIKHNMYPYIYIRRYLSIIVIRKNKIIILNKTNNANNKPTFFYVNSRPIFHSFRKLRTLMIDDVIPRVVVVGVFAVNADTLYLMKILRLCTIRYFIII